MPARERRPVSRSWRLSLLFLTTAACLPAFVSCNNDGVTAPVYDPPKTPAEVLSRLQEACVNRDLAAYTRLLSSDFIFDFTSYDGQKAYDPCPPHWALHEELDSAGRMFQSSLVDKIELSFNQLPAVPLIGDSLGISRIEVNTCNLRIFTRKEDGSPWEWRVPNGTATFFIKQTPDPPGGATSSWRIIRWTDRPIGGGARLPAEGRVEQQTWGAIKHFYAPGDAVRPARVSTLEVTAVTDHSVELSWTAVGDDSLSGWASSYDLRYATGAIADTSWNAAHGVQISTPPLRSGETEHTVADGLAAGTTYHFALKVSDEAGNMSALSNAVEATTAGNP